ncbi:hypothetical protein [Streptomyces sp. NBC_00102]|uniref:hypothetical protein n=1 Tax=Streptomyces sp. NBC_00102 TaxID=2975652 RepID=UPI00224DF80F|nr:hypothetical protein [Streptomyces sp. NBC_00102]MCX5397259.1 hypothetical protein [Streptomyces sp. NBC_00102]
MSWLDQTNSVLGVIGFALTIVTLVKVQSVHRAQSEERALLRRLYGTESLAGHLRSAASFLRQGEQDARNLAEELVRMCGQIEGISRALDSMNRIRGGTPESRSVVRLVERGYYTPPFYARVVNDAQSNADFLMYRNLQIANVDILQAMERAAKRGVHIRILAISSESTDGVLEQAAMVLPWPQVPPDTLRRQLAESEDRIRSVVAGWPTRARRNFEYRGYVIAPNMHFARMDGTVMQGFVGTLSPAQPDQLDDRGYVELPRDREPGATLSRHFEELWAQSAAHVVLEV